MEKSWVFIKLCEASKRVHGSDVTLTFVLSLWRAFIQTERSGNYIRNKLDYMISPVHAPNNQSHTCNLVCGTGLGCLLEVSLGVECWRSKLSLCPKATKIRSV